MDSSEQAAWIFAGDAPGVWWLVHTRKPRFAARLLSAEEFAAQPRLAAWVPHGLNRPVPVHFNLGADVLVITEFLDPVAIDESHSPPSAILTDAMIEALHACQRAIAEVAIANPAFAPLAERAEQFIVGWRLQRESALRWRADHLSGAAVNIEFDPEGDCTATLTQLPRPLLVEGWDPERLRERLEHAAGERALAIDSGWERLHGIEGNELQLEPFAVLAQQDRRRLSWCAVERELPGHAQRAHYVGLRISGPVAFCHLTPVEIDARSPLHLGAHPLSEEDVDAILLLRQRYGLSAAVNLLAARHYGWFEDTIEPVGARRRSSPLPGYPCEVELLHGGEPYAAIVFEPADGRGLFHLVIAPHRSIPPDQRDPAALLAFEGMVCRREDFHLPRYLAEL